MKDDKPLTPYQRDLIKALLDLAVPIGKAHAVAVDFGKDIQEHGLTPRRAALYVLPALDIWN
jgi:hypothetical protein